MKREVTTSHGPAIETHLGIILLSDLFHMDAGLGVLTWKQRTISMCSNLQSYLAFNTRMAGKVFGAVSTSGYVEGRIFNRTYRAHRVIWAMHVGDWPKCQIDHINGVKSDNSIRNMRDVTNAENRKNMPRRSKNSSGVVGVVRYRNKWLAQIKHNGKNKVVGRFYNFDDAVLARKAAEENFGYHPNHGREPSWLI